MLAVLLLVLPLLLPLVVMAPPAALLPSGLLLLLPWSVGCRCLTSSLESLAARLLQAWDVCEYLLREPSNVLFSGKGELHPLHAVLGCLPSQDP